MIHEYYVRIQLPLMEPNFEGFQPNTDSRLSGIHNPLLHSLSDREVHESERTLELRLGIYQPVFKFQVIRYLGLLVQSGDDIFELGFRPKEFCTFEGAKFQEAMNSWQAHLPPNTWNATDSQKSRFILRFPDKILFIANNGAFVTAGSPFFWENHFLEAIAFSSSSILYRAGTQLICRVMTGGIALSLYYFVLNQEERSRYQKNPAEFLPKIDDLYAGGGPRVHEELNPRAIQPQKRANV